MHFKDKGSVKTYINAVLTSRDHVMTAECIVINSVSCAVLVTRQRKNDVPVSEKAGKKMIRWPITSRAS